MKTINYAIDLGTTNSLIARSIDGELRVFKNPFGQREVLPSVVGFRGERTLIGEKALEYLLKDPQNVFGGFKRKMGTDEVFWVNSLDKSISPIELSGYILKELRNFVQDETNLNEIIITIPASFDTLQSNATKKAGYESGFENVLLLQEPIAACLAFANSNKDVAKEGKWLVYDLGGGTFDVAIVEISDEDLHVVDHKGDNFLGGLDFDMQLVNKLILPEIYKTKGLSGLKKEAEEMTLNFQKLHQILLYKAETIKKELSSSPVSSLDMTIECGDDEVDFYMDITQDQFNSVIRAKVEYSLQLIDDLLEANDMAASEINQVVLVGGSTYVPLVKESILTKLKVSVNQSVDPTNAVVVGAAYYAATKVARVKAEVQPDVVTEVKAPFAVELSYMHSSREAEEMVLSVFTGEYIGINYRIVRSDKGYDSGMRRAESKVTDMVTLVPGALNHFDISYYDANHQPISSVKQEVVISQGLYNVDGQPLPNDICIEVDDFDDDRTKLDIIFKKNDILPLKKKIYKEISKTLLRTGEDKLIINVVEGDGKSSPSANQVIGCIEIDPKQLGLDLIKGSDVEIDLEISESRDLSVKVFLSISDQEFEETFNPSSRNVSIDHLRDELRQLSNRSRSDFKRFEEEEAYETMQELADIQNELETLVEMLDDLDNTPDSDAKYHIEERKRRVAQKFDSLDGLNKAAVEKKRYLQEKEYIEEIFRDFPAIELSHGKKFEKAKAVENEVMRTNQYHFIRTKANEINLLRREMSWQVPAVVYDIFYSYKFTDIHEYNDPKRAQQLIDSGDSAVERDNVVEVKSILSQLNSMLPESSKDKNNIKGTGLE
ncbi:MAG: molecular chaperone DnaK [Crocinitomicaceae bacterium]|jgi:molecular chaperone DnaK